MLLITVCQNCVAIFKFTEECHELRIAASDCLYLFKN